MLMGSAKKKEIILDLKVDPKAEVILEGDKGKINQVLLNLIGNALKFTPEKGKVSVQLDLEEFSEELVYLHYVVEDTGIGISEEHVRHLTEPFYQVESSNSRITWWRVGNPKSVGKRFRFWIFRLAQKIDRVLPKAKLPGPHLERYQGNGGCFSLEDFTC